jgi:GTP diphosphokinase / guanosine-3',5'-bis(diphosphate) 3'-diphosphatase
MYTSRDIINQMNNATEADKHLVEKAYEWAARAHENHTRYSGEPYFTHVAAVGYKLAESGYGPRTIAAGLLHDTIEDTQLSVTDIKREFGDEILFLVEGVTKLSSVRYYGTDRHNESLRKLFVATSQDIRVLIIKLTDRLHNMETLGHVPTEKQVRIARETLEIYVPIAHRLGMGKIRKALEDLAFPYVYPNEYKRVISLLPSPDKLTEILEKERKVLQRRLAEVGLLSFSTSYRVKGLFSLYHKLKRKEWNIEAVQDLLAMRVIVDSIENCYRTLGIIHEIWRPLPGRMKDYIAFPKPNGYQSIHTTINTPNGTIMEIQIRTKQMHQEAEFGVASHLIYKQPITTDHTQNGRFTNLLPSLFRPFSNCEDVGELDEKNITKDTPHNQKIPQWISQISEVHKKDTKTGTEFMDVMKQDFFSHRIFVFTPKGDVVDLPLGATPIDFAYAIHSEIGNQMSGAKVNKKLVQLNTELKNGDIVEIETKKNATPSKKWLDMTKTSLAKRHIRGALGLPAIQK